MIQSGKKTIIGIIGIGKWGQNLLRNFAALETCEIKYVCDGDQARLDKFSKEYPSTRFITEIDLLLKDNAVEAIVIATPAPAHFSVAKKCLEAGKHVFVEKPITLDIAEAQELVALAKKANKQIMVGHLLLYHPAIAELKRIIELNELGRILCVYTQRLNLGTIRNTENVVWSLAPHDISIILHLIGKLPNSVSVLGGPFLQKGIEDVAFVNMHFESGEIGHVHVSWLDPTKTRKTIVIGSKKMAIFDEILNELVVIDKGFDGSLQVRSGDDKLVPFDRTQSLKLECQHFIDCVRENKVPVSNGENGIAVLKVLSAAERSTKKGGQNELL